MIALNPNQPPHVLVVEDDGEMRALLADALSDEGYQVAQAEDGAQAASRMTQESFDLVITDMKMPRMGGLELLPVIRKTWPETPVIIITGFGDASTLADAYVKGAYSYISKPFSMQDLKSIARKALFKKGGVS
jgi:two-component system response regulator PilR (NtrC family)